MSTLNERHALAERHVSEGRRTIDRLHALIARQQVRGRSTVSSQGLLASLQHTQAVFEDDLRRIEDERG